MPGAGTTTSSRLIVVLMLAGCEGKSGGAAQPSVAAQAEAPAEVNSIDEAPPSSEHEAPAAHTGYLAGTLGDRAVRFEVLPAKGNNLAPMGRSWSAVLLAAPEEGSTERFNLRLQNFDFGSLSGGKPVAPLVRRQRGQIAALSYTDPSGEAYGGHVGPTGTVEVTIDTWDPASMRLTGKVSGSLSSKSGKTLELRDGTFEIRRQSQG